MNKKDDVKTLIKSLKDYYDASSIPVYIPTLQEEVPFKVLTIKEHRDLFDSVNDEAGIEVVINSFNDLILNCCSKEHSTLLTVLDRSLILLSLRSHLFGPSIKAQDDNEKVHTINIQEHIDKCTKSSIPDGLLKYDIAYGAFSVSCSIPSLVRDKSTNSQLSNRIKKDDTKTLGHLFIYELIKYINTITFNDETFTFADLSIHQQIQICELLPISISSKLTTYINSIKIFEDSYLKISDNLTLSLDSILLDAENA